MIFDHEHMFAIFPHEKSLIVVSGGVGRLYQGLLPALMQAPLSRYLSGFFFQRKQMSFFQVWRHCRKCGHPDSVGELWSPDRSPNCDSLSCVRGLADAHHAHRHGEDNVASEEILAGLA